ncbi:hypothetical protein [Candidatus Nanohalococcus occultus]|uniref:hypothetical protein n=1 Tax=Candidatus Nanohalococcus occultus TaxID=2978047 RepID=UPI0039E0C2B8
MKRILALLTAALILSSGAAAKNFTVEDSSGNPLFQVNGNTGEKQLNNGAVNISDGEPIAAFSQSGIRFDQPLSLNSPGALSVQNGIDLTGTSSNTIDSYSTFYLSTSSGSPSDIVLQPTGEVGVDSNLSTTGNIDIQGNTLEGVGNLVDETGTACGANEFINGNGQCEVDTDTDTTNTEDEIEQAIFDTGDNDQGNLGLNGNEIVDTQGSVTLGGGDVDIPDGDFYLNGDGRQIRLSSSTENIQNSGSIAFEEGSTSSGIKLQYDGVGPDNGALRIQDMGDSDENLAIIDRGGNLQVPNGDVTIGSSQNIEEQGTNAMLDFKGNANEFYSINTPGGGSGAWGIYDTANGQRITVFNEGGNVEIPNGDVDVNGNDVRQVSQVSFNSDEEITGSGDLCLGDRCA